MISTPEITVFTKFGGPLTKRISLREDGSLKSDGSACLMAHGEARRLHVANVAQLATSIENLGADQAIGLGRLRAGLPDQVRIVTKGKLNGQAHPDIIARTGNDIIYRKGQSAFALLDFDTKGMPPAIKAELEQHGGFWPALTAVLPDLAAVARVIRQSTSAGLYRSDTGERLRGSDGVHVYIAVKNGEDVERFLTALHQRCWLAGFGWYMIGAGGQLLDRSIVDRMVGAPERLVFEGGPLLDPPLEQDQNSRRPIAVHGDVLDTLKACPPLTIAEMARLREIKTRQEYHLAPDAAKARADFINKQAERLAERTGMSAQAAKQTIARQCEGVLLPNVVLPFDDEALAGCTVADVLVDPDRFEGAALADPLEGVDYGAGKAKIMRRADGSPWINSFAHGRTVYELRFDAKAVRAALGEGAVPRTLLKTIIGLAATADLDAAELEELRDIVSERTHVGKRTIASMMKEACKQRHEQTRREEQEQRFAERHDPRPMIAVPELDDPWLPQMGVLSETIGQGGPTRPSTRDIDGAMARTLKIVVPNSHAFATANHRED